MIQLGLYEQLINKLLSSKLDLLEKEKFFIKETIVDKEEAAKYLGRYLSSTIQYALNSLPKENCLEKQIELCNKIIYLIRDEINEKDFEENLLVTEGKILSAIFTKLNAPFSDFEKHLKEITPYTRLSQSELFTGSNSGISLESELKKEILSADKICFLVSFIKWTGIRIFQKELLEFTESGKELKIITTSYMGATDLRAVEFLSGLKNTTIKVSYNTANERLHAKAYLFLRNTGFHTGYIGSSNISHSALTNGLEWNMKITTQEISHIIDKFQKTFDTYWQDNEFEFFDKSKDVEKLSRALKNQRIYESIDVAAYFDIAPFHYQTEILEKLGAERTVHNRFKNLIVAATGTGKTVISGFDYKNFKLKNGRARLLYVAHRKEILQQAQATFRGILKDNSFGELWVDGLIPERNEYVFASVQTLNSQLKELQLSKDYYDFIIIDEVHHIAADSYRPILERFTPQILLGLTATPERMDNKNILEDFCNVIAAEIRLPEALNRKLLCPFQYFGITDSIDLSSVPWSNGRYVPSELTKIYTSSDDRVRNIIKNLKEYLNNIHNVRALCFCVSQEHAQFMAMKFTLAGLKSDYLVSDNSHEREEKRRKLQNKEINYLFVRDIFNEGVDIREIDTVLFLRPTESLTIFLQQLGRGLRLADKKDCLTVLDFVGNSRPEYDFESKFRALVGKTNTSIQKEIENDFPHLPLGCSIILEKIAKEHIIENIKNAIGFNRNQLINKIINFKFNTTLPLTLKNFIEFYHIQLPLIYKKDNWSRLCCEAGVIADFTNQNEKEITGAITNKWLSGNSASYFQFILKLAKKNFDIDYTSLPENEQAMCLMLHYDIWFKAGGFRNLSESIKAIGNNSILVSEIIEVLELLIDKIDFVEREITLSYSQPLKLHSRYTRDQILAAFQLHSFEKKLPNYQGVAYSASLNTELLFVTLNKSEKDYSPTTLFDDFAISDIIFHWQSQNAARPDIGMGLSYIEQEKNNKTILLFVREKNEDEYGNNMSYVFLGDAKYLTHEGAKPMNINWKLRTPMPAYIWKDSAKLANG
jgi:superfamily II DNA or RNA helicase